MPGVICQWCNGVYEGIWDRRTAGIAFTVVKDHEKTCDENPANGTGGDQ